MTIEQIGSIGELVAALATVATLAYLASQIRQSTRASRGAAADRSSNSSIQVNLAVFQDPELTQLWFRGLRQCEDLTPTEQERFDLVAASYLTAMRNDFALSAEGLLPDALLASSMAKLNWYADQRGFALNYWPKFRGQWPVDFGEIVDKAVSNGPHAAQQRAAADSA